jgi:hypothetical protein
MNIRIRYKVTSILNDKDIRGPEKEQWIRENEDVGAIV